MSMQLFSFGHPCEHQLHRTCIGGSNCPLNGYPDTWCCSFIKGKINFKRDRPCEGPRCHWDFVHPPQSQFDEVTQVLEQSRPIAARLDEACDTDLLSFQINNPHIIDTVQCALHMMRHPPSTCARRVGQLLAYAAVLAGDQDVFVQLLKTMKKPVDGYILGAYAYLTQSKLNANRTDKSGGGNQKNSATGSNSRKQPKKKDGKEDITATLANTMVELMNAALSLGGQLVDREDQHVLQAMLIKALSTYPKNDKRHQEMLERAIAKFGHRKLDDEEEAAAKREAARREAAAAAVAASVTATAVVPSKNTVDLSAAPTSAATETTETKTAAITAVPPGVAEEAPSAAAPAALPAATATAPVAVPATGAPLRPVTASAVRAGSVEAAPPTARPLSANSSPFVTAQTAPTGTSAIAGGGASHTPDSTATVAAPPSATAAQTAAFAAAAAPAVAAVAVSAASDVAKSFPPLAPSTSVDCRSSAEETSAAIRATPLLGAAAATAAVSSAPGTPLPPLPPPTADVTAALPTVSPHVLSPLSPGGATAAATAPMSAQPTAGRPSSSVGSAVPTPKAASAKTPKVGISAVLPLLQKFRMETMQKNAFIPLLDFHGPGPRLYLCGGQLSVLAQVWGITPLGNAAVQLPQDVATRELHKYYENLRKEKESEALAAAAQPKQDVAVQPVTSLDQRSPFWDDDDSDYPWRYQDEDSSDFEIYSDSSSH